MTTIKTAEQVVTDALYAEESEVHQGSAVHLRKATRLAKVAVAALRDAGLLAEVGIEWDALSKAREHFSAIAGSGEIKVDEATGEKRGIDYQAKVWAERGERICREALAAPAAPVDEGKIAETAEQVNAVHHFHGVQCLCGFESYRSRSRTEHITGALVEALSAKGKGGKQ